MKLINLLCLIALMGTVVIFSFWAGCWFWNRRAFVANSEPELEMMPSPLIRFRKEETVEKECEPEIINDYWERRAEELRIETAQLQAQLQYPTCPACELDDEFWEMEEKLELCERALELRQKVDEVSEQLRGLQ